VFEHVGDRDRLLAPGSELGPQLGDPGVVTQYVALHQPVHRGGEDALADREDREDRVPVDGPSGGGVGHPGPRVDHELVTDVGGHLCTELGPGPDQVVEPALDGLLGRSSR
jgi:hypothetical protein